MYIKISRIINTSIMQTAKPKFATTTTNNNNKIAQTAKNKSTDINQNPLSSGETRYINIMAVCIFRILLCSRCQLCNKDPPAITPPRDDQSK